MSFAALFPGQLSERAGMGAALAARYDYVTAFFAEASRRSGVDLAATFFGAGSPGLHDDRPAQTGVFAVSVALLDVLEREHGITPAAAAGYSLGTYAAFVACGVLPRWAALEVLLEAERLLSAARSSGDTEGTMGFVIGLPRGGVEVLIGGITNDPRRLSIATENAAAQFVVTGERRAVEDLVEAARPRALKADLLPIDFPMHSDRLSGVCDGLERFLERSVRFSPPRAALYAPMLGRRVETIEEARGVLARQISRPSLWATTLQAMGDAGFMRFAELGPGDVLTKMLRWTLREATGVAACDPESVAALAGSAMVSR
jgi:[acyl-carrier-protein] S-malonyltransferase